VSTAVRVTPPQTADMVAGVDVVTEFVVTVTVAAVAPAGTVTLAGIVAAVESEESETVAPPLGAAALNVTVAVDVPPPMTLAGLSDSADSAVPVVPDALIVSVALFVTF
jgi:hypothetical protein